MVRGTFSPARAWRLAVVVHVPLFPSACSLVLVLLKLSFGTLFLELFRSRKGDWSTVDGLSTIQAHDAMTGAMTNPYEPAITAEGQLTVSHRPWLICLMVSYASILVWFSLLGVSFYAWQCVFALVFLAPINAFAIAPSCAHVCGRSLVLATVLHVCIGVLIVGGPWPTIVRQFPSFRWTMVPTYLVFSWVPPILLGSFSYTIVWIIRIRKAVAKIETA